jgi:hypothetical protein
MTPSIPKRVVHRGRLFPEIQWSPEKKARYQAEITAFRQHCLVIFEQVRPELMKEHYGWYIAIEPDSGDYFIDPDKETARKKAREQYPNAISGMFRLNESGATGRI